VFLTLVVRSATWESEGVLGLVLADPDGAPLPAWTPGAHVDLVLPSGTVRSYSLCGEPSDRASYRIAVLREEGGRGGSAELHSTQLVGRRLPVRGPRNQFELVEAERYVFIAGGIGITPLLPMLRAVAAVGRSWTLHYLGRSRGSMAFLAQVAALTGGSVHLYPRDEVERPEIAAALAGVEAGTAVYCCGPDSLIRATEAAGLGPDVLHLERFGRPTLTPRPVESSVEQLEADPDGDFQVELATTGGVLDVAPGESILEAVRKVRQGLSFSCSDGYCGTCETAVLKGLPDHRDTVLTTEEQAENGTMMICVSRSRTPLLVLDL
jgi:ferredoxin-NADP reductase